MNILFTICARAGSKGVKNKNIREFCGYPLLYYTLSIISLFQKEHGNEYDKIIVAINTDSNLLIEQAKKTTCPITYIDRVESLATDVSAKLDVVRDTYRKCAKKYCCDFDIIMDLDLTSPLRRLQDIENAITTLVKTEACEVVFSVTDARRSPYFNMVTKSDGWYRRVIDSNFTARQQAPLIYDMNASIYAYSKEFLCEEMGQLGNCNAEIVEMKDTGILDIDSENDFILMSVIAEFFFHQDKNFSRVKEHIYEIRD